MDIPTVLSEVEGWPIDERVEFVQLIWDQIADSGWQPTLTADQKAELDRRIIESKLAALSY